MQIEGEERIHDIPNFVTTNYNNLIVNRYFQKHLKIREIFYLALSFWIWIYSPRPTTRRTRQRYGVVILLEIHDFIGVIERIDEWPVDIQRIPSLE